MASQCMLEVLHEVRALQLFLHDLNAGAAKGMGWKHLPHAAGHDVFRAWDVDQGEFIIAVELH